jgi:hypothetical protein
MPKYAYIRKVKITRTYYEIWESVHPFADERKILMNNKNVKNIEIGGRVLETVEEFRAMTESEQAIFGYHVKEEEE